MHYQTSVIWSCGSDFERALVIGDQYGVPEGHVDPGIRRPDMYLLAILPIQNHMCL